MGVDRSAGKVIDALMEYNDANQMKNKINISRTSTFQSRSVTVEGKASQVDKIIKELGVRIKKTADKDKTEKLKMVLTAISTEEKKERDGVAKFHHAFSRRDNIVSELLGKSIDKKLSKVTPSTKPYSKVGKEALEFARQKLKENPNIQPTQILATWKGTDTHRPINPEIELLTTLFNEVQGNFRELIKKNKENPWSHQEVITAADECMKIAYAISNLTLDDLEAFTKPSFEGKKRTNAEALIKQDSYQYRTFYDCTNIYHDLRGEIKFTKRPRSDDDKEDFYRSEDYISRAHSTPFYKKGTIQNSWNALYNDYCNRVRLHVTEKELNQLDTRPSKWTKKDTGIKTFKCYPDQQPT